MSLSRPSVPPGQTTVELLNQGEDPHNLRMRREDGFGPTYDLPKTPSQESAEGTFDTTQARGASTARSRGTRRRG